MVKVRLALCQNIIFFVGNTLKDEPIEKYWMNLKNSYRDKKLLTKGAEATDSSLTLHLSKFVFVSF